MGEWYAVASNPDVLGSDLLEGGVLFDLNRKQYFALNASGMLLWSALENGADLRAAEAWLLGTFSGNGAEDPLGIRRFVDVLLREQLAVPAQPDGATAFEPPADVPPRWETPSVEAHGNPLAQVILSPFDPTVPIPE